jgi:YVTN family beta-propeller protein
MRRAMQKTRPVPRRRPQRAFLPGRRSLAGVAAVSAVVAMAASGCGSGRVGEGSATPTFGPVPASSAPPARVTGSLPKGVLASIPVDSPMSVGVGLGSVWVGSHRGDWLYRVDPATNKVIATIDIGINSCGPIVTAFGRAWVSGCDDDPETVAVSAKTNQVVGKFPSYSLPPGFGAGSAWIGNLFDGTLYRLNPKTLAVQAKIRVGQSAFCVVLGGGSVWVGDSFNGTVHRIDPATGKVIATIPAGVAGADGVELMFVAGKLWVYPGFGVPPVSDRGNKVWRIDPHGDTVTQEILRGLSDLSGGLSYGQPVTAMGSLWLRGTGTKVYRYQGRTLKLLHAYPADPSAVGWTAIGFGSLWVGNMDTNTLWRDRLTG